MQKIFILALCSLLTSCILPLTLIEQIDPGSENTSSTSTVSVQLGAPTEVFSLPSPRALSHWDIAQLDTAANMPWSQLEKDILLSTNMLRQNPTQFAKDFLQPLIDHTRSGKLVYLPGNIIAFNHEGITAIEEAYQALINTESRGILQASTGIYKAAKKHVQDQGPSGEMGHTGSDGSSPQDRMAQFGQCGDYCGGENISYGRLEGLWHVLSLVVDDNVPSRGHRLNLLRAEYKQVGIACGSHRRYQEMCVQDFAGSYDE